MKAWVLHGINDLRYEDVSKPQIKSGEVLVKVQWTGICSSDIARVFVSGAYHYPIILCHEFSGIVEEVNDKSNSNWVGKRVGVFPLLPCFECESCKSKSYETCYKYSYIGSRQDGAFAEYVTVPVWNLIELPESVSFEQATMLEPVSVAFHAVKHADLSKISSVAVVGSGAIGRVIAQWLKIYGVKNVFLLGRNDELTQKVDVCFEVVGSVESLRFCIESVKPNGQIVLVGNPPADFKMEQKLYWQILRKQIVVSGSWNSSFPNNWQEAVSAIGAGKLDLQSLVTHRYKRDKLSEAFEMMYSKSEPRCKVLVEF
jgi:L-iditol 2-dehydrogenase